MAAKLHLYEISKGNLEEGGSQHLGYVVGRGPNDAIRKYERTTGDSDELIAAEIVGVEGFRISVSRLEKKASK